MDNTNNECLLTLAVPAAVQDELSDCLQAHPDWVTGFSVSPAEGFGRGAALDTALEQVLGRANRRLFTLVMRAKDARALVARLREQFPSPQIAWWITPVIEFGRFA